MHPSRFFAIRSCVVPLLITMSAFCLVSNTAAQVPTTLNYQGRLLQNTIDQGAASGPVDIVFSIWTGPSSDGGATQLWTETWTGVALSNGIFSVLLGSNGTPLDPADFQDDDSLYLQLEVDGETLLPRQQLGSAPFAMVDEPGNELQDLELTGNTLGLSGDPTTVDLAPFLDDTDEQDLSLSGNSLVLTNDPTSVDLSPFLDNTDEQDLSLSGNSLVLTNDPTAIDLSGYLDNTDNQSLSLSGNTLGLTNGGSVSLAGYLDNTDSQNIASVLANGSNAGDQDLTNLEKVDIDRLTIDFKFTCTDCITKDAIEDGAIKGNHHTDFIYALHIDCHGPCTNMSVRDACDSVEIMNNTANHYTLLSFSCTHSLSSSSAFVDCPVGDSGNDHTCRSINVRAANFIPCQNGDGADVVVLCRATDIPR